MHTAHHFARRLIRTAAALLGSVFAASLYAQPPSEASVFRRDVAPSIYGITYDAGRDTLYVAEAGPQARTEPSRVLQLDPRTLAVMQSVDLDETVFDVALSGDRSRLYAVHSLDAAFSVIDLTRGVVHKTIPLTRARTAKDKNARVMFRKIVVDEGSARLFLAETTWPNGALFVVDAKTLTVEKVLPDMGLYAMGMALDAAGGRLFIANMDHEILVLDTRSLTIAARWRVNVDQPLSLAYDARRNLLYVSDQGREFLTHQMTGYVAHYKPLGKGNKVLVVNAANGEPVREIQTGAGPLELLLNEDGTRLYVTQREDGSVAAYDTATGVQTQRYPLPIHPNSMALDAQGKRLFVTIKDRIENETTPESVARIRLPG